MKRMLIALACLLPAATQLLVPAGSRAATGPRVVYAHSNEQLESRGIFSIAPSGRGRERLTRRRPYILQWSPDRSLIAFSQESCPTRNDCDAFINVMRPDGSGVRRFTDDAYSIDSFDWSPDSTRIVYSAFDPADGDYDLYVATAGEEAGVPLTDTPDDYETDPDWSPDGSTIVFRRSGNTAEDIFAAAPDGSGERRLTNDEHLDSQPRWSPDGAKIAFVTSRDDTSEGEDAPYTNQLYVMDPDGSGPVRISTTERTLKFGPRWSLDSAQIAWDEECDMDYCETDLDVWVAPVAGGRPTNVTAASARNEHSPQWSPNGRRLVVVRWARSSALSGLYSVRLADGHLRTVADWSGPEGPFAWQSW